MPGLLKLFCSAAPFKKKDFSMRPPLLDKPRC